MRKALTATAAAVALAGTVIGAAAPAEARHYGGYGRGYYGYHHGGGRTGLAIGAGILGLAAGAAIASDHRSYGRGYYGGGYGGGYYGGGYYDGPAYYAPPPPPPYAYGGYCRSDWSWDGYRGRYVRVRYCD